MMVHILDDDLSVPIAAVALSIKDAMRELDVILNALESRYTGRGDRMDWPDYKAATYARAEMRSAAEYIDRLKKMEGAP